MFEQIVDRFVADGSEPFCKSLIDYAQDNRLSEADIAYLAIRLAESGDRMTLPQSHLYIDIPSTGGASSLSTLLCPLFAVAMGYVVPKLAVPGRPAGGIDVLAQLPGYRYLFSKKEIAGILNQCGYAHFLAADTFAPRDAELFAYRKMVGAINVPDLAIASLLSKKIAVGITRIGLDIRVTEQGNFGSSWEEALSNARRFSKVASRVGVNAKCFITDGHAPYQPYIGRSEALIALHDVLEGTMSDWLLRHVIHCFSMAKASTNSNISFNSMSQQGLKKIFADHLSAQGSSYSAFQNAVEVLHTTQRESIVAQKEGFLMVDLNELRKYMVEAQTMISGRGMLFPDPLGIIMVKNAGDYVKEGEVIASIRCAEDITIDVLTGLKQSLSIRRSPGRIGGYEEVING